MNSLARKLIAATLVVTTGIASAGPRYYEPPPRHHHHHGGPALGGLVLGLAVAVPLIALARHADRVERAPEVVYVPPPAPLPAPVAYVPSRPAPIVYPRNGQSDAQREDDHRDCNRWATTQPAAMSDASVFNRAVDACMDGRGYTLR